MWNTMDKLNLQMPYFSFIYIKTSNFVQSLKVNDTNAHDIYVENDEDIYTW